MAITQDTFNGDGSNLGPFSFTFKWLKTADVKVSVNGVLKTAGTHYNLQSLNYTTRTGGQVLFTAGNAPPVGTGNIRVYRETDDTVLPSTFSSGSSIRAKDLNDNFTQNLYVAQETKNTVLGAFLPNNSVQTSMIVDGAVTSQKLGSNLTVDLASGSAATPSLTFDSNTGIYSPAEDQLALSTGGTGRLFVDANGNVGVGATNPTSALHIQKSSGELATFEVTSAASSYVSFAESSTKFGYIGSATGFVTTGGRSDLALRSNNNFILAIGNTERARIDSSGRVGIGTTSPNSLLHVNGEARFGASEQLRLTAASTDAYIDAISSGGNLVFRTNGGAGAVERARIESSGRLLVGTSSPYAVQGFNRHHYFCPSAGDNNNNVVLSAVGNGFPGVYFTRTRGATPTTYTVVQDGDNLGILEFFGADGTDYSASGARITCQVDGTPGDNDMPGRLVFSTTADGASSPTERMRIKANGTINFSNVAIYADNTAAIAGGLAVGDVYRTSTGQLMIRY